MALLGLGLERYFPKITLSQRKQRGGSKSPFKGTPLNTAAITTILLSLVHDSACSQARQHLCSSAVAPWLLLLRPQSSSSLLLDTKGAIQSSEYCRGKGKDAFFAAANFRLSHRGAVAALIVERSREPWMRPSVCVWSAAESLVSAPHGCCTGTCRKSSVGECFRCVGLR